MTSFTAVAVAASVAQYLGNRLALDWRRLLTRRVSVPFQPDLPQCVTAVASSCHGCFALVVVCKALYVVCHALDDFYGWDIGRCHRSDGQPVPRDVLPRQGVVLAEPNRQAYRQLRPAHDNGVRGWLSVLVESLAVIGVCGARPKTRSLCLDLGFSLQDLTNAAAQVFFGSFDGGQSVWYILSSMTTSVWFIRTVGAASARNIGTPVWSVCLGFAQSC